MNERQQISKAADLGMTLERYRSLIAKAQVWASQIREKNKRKSATKGAFGNVKFPVDLEPTPRKRSSR